MGLGNRVSMDRGGLARSSAGEEVPACEEAAANAPGNQIQHKEFEDFLEGYFEEVDEDKFNRIISRTEIDETQLARAEKGEGGRWRWDSAVRGLVGCLVDDGNILEDFNELVREARKNTETVGDEDLFDAEEILELLSPDGGADLARLYREQVSINNRRKEVLRAKLEERLVYQGCWMVLRAIDSDVEELLRAKRGNRRGREGPEERLAEAVGRRQEFLELFCDSLLLEDDYMGHKDLFEAGKDVDARRYGIEPYDYFCS